MLLFTDDELLLKKLSQMGNSLERLDSAINWEIFRPALLRIFGNPKKNPSKGGRPPYDYLMMFKILLLARLYNLSDDDMEYQLHDRLSFRHFVGCDAEKIPDAKTIWLYRERLTKSGKEQELFDSFYSILEEEGLLAHKGQIVDASFVEVPKQRNTRKENEQIKEGEEPEVWSSAKRSQKDTDARWTKKGGVDHFGYKNHVCVDSKSKLIKSFEVTSASVHDSNVLADICDTHEPVFDDSAYTGKSVPEGCKHYTARRSYRNKPLTDDDKKFNRKLSRIRCRVEHVFGFIENTMKGSTFRGVGIKRAKTNVTLTNLVYNICRFEQIKRLNLNTWA